MQSPERPDPKPTSRAKEARDGFALRMDRAAGDLNPLLVILTIGLPGGIADNRLAEGVAWSGSMPARRFAA